MLSTSSVSTSSLTFTSSLMMSLNSLRRCDSGSATVSFGSGRRLRSLLALRTDDAAEHTPRTSSMVRTRASSRGKSSGFGNFMRCTERSPVSPRQMTSVIIGSSGAATRVKVSSTVYSVLKASGVSFQKRSRERRTYQLVSTSQKERTSSHARATSVLSSASCVLAIRLCSFARM